MSARDDAPLRVVVVDDTEDLRELLRIALTRDGFDVVAEAGDGQRGIDVVREHRPDLVLLDLSMPVMDGLEALPSIRRLVPEATIVVLSGFGASQMSARALAAGADGYLQKGASLGSILDHLRDLTADRRPGPAAPEPAAPEPDVPAGRTVAARAALDLAPYGVVELADEPLLRVVHANETTQRLLSDRAVPGTPLREVSVELADLVAAHRLDPDASPEVRLDGGVTRATIRRTAGSVLVYLDPASADVALLRRAIATTAHEIRGPVSVICGVAETIGWAAAELDPAERQRLLESVARQARLLDRITTDLLTAAQIQRGTLRVDLQTVDPRAAVEAVVADRFDVTLSVEDDRPVRADPLRLEQMLSNLIANAHTYGRAPYHLRIRPDGDLVRLDVADGGDGVPEEFRDRLFREFARAHTTGTGTGLGLYVVRTLAEAQSGSVAYAPGPDGGAVFSIRLPAASGH